MIMRTPRCDLHTPAVDAATVLARTFVALQAALDALRQGRAAADDYRRLLGRGLGEAAASRRVQQAYFGNR
jgi:hypothetical protein